MREKEKEKNRHSTLQHSFSIFTIIILFAFASLRLAFFLLRYHTKSNLIECVKGRKNFAFLSELFNYFRIRAKKVKKKVLL